MACAQTMVEMQAGTDVYWVSGLEGVTHACSLVARMFLTRTPPPVVCSGFVCPPRPRVPAELSAHQAARSESHQTQRGLRTARKAGLGSQPLRAYRVAKRSLPSQTACTAATIGPAKQAVQHEEDGQALLVASPTRSNPTRLPASDSRGPGSRAISLVGYHCPLRGAAAGSL